MASAGLALVQGRPDQAEELIERTQSSVYDLVLQGYGVYGLAMFLIRRAQGRLDRIRPVLEHLTRTPSRATWAPGLTVAYAELGMEEQARVVLNDLVNRLDAAPHDAAYPPTLAFLADAAELLGATDSAGPLYDALLPHAGQVLVAGLHFPVGPADRHLAAMAHLLGDQQAASAHLGAATMIAARSQSPLWRDQIDRTAARLATSPPTDERETVRHHPLLSTLSPREVEVLRAVADGLSNKAIAERLFISPNTAANHVRSIMQKTGARNRTDAAAIAHRAGLN